MSVSSTERDHGAGPLIGVPSPLQGAPDPAPVIFTVGGMSFAVDSGPFASWQARDIARTVATATHAGYPQQLLGEVVEAYGEAIDGCGQ